MELPLLSWAVFFQVPGNGLLPDESGRKVIRLFEQRDPKVAFKNPEAVRERGP